MYLRNLLIVLVISCAMVGNSVAMAATSMNQSSQINDMIASGDIVLDDAPVDYLGSNLTLVEAPENVDAGAILIVPALLAAAKFYVTFKPYIDGAVAGTLQVANKYIEEKAQKNLQVAIFAEASKYDDPERPEYQLAEFLDKNKIGAGSIKDLMQKFVEYVAEFGGAAGVSAVAAYGHPGLGLGLTALAISDIWDNIKLLDASKDAIDDLSTTFAVQDYLLNSKSLDLEKIQSLSELVKGGEFGTSSDLVYWTEKSNAKAGYSSFGSISYPGVSSDQLFGFVHTGLGANSDQGFMLQTVLPIKNSSAVFNARYNFVTTEFPQYLGSQYNDSFVIKIEDIASGATKVLASFSGSLNTLFDPNDPVVQNLPAEFLDMVASGGGQTGWVTESSDQIALKSGGKYRIYIDVNDVGDKIYDSALLIDKVSLR